MTAWSRRSAYGREGGGREVKGPRAGSGNAEALGALPEDADEEIPNADTAICLKDPAEITTSG